MIYVCAVILWPPVISQKPMAGMKITSTYWDGYSIFFLPRSAMIDWSRLTAAILPVAILLLAFYLWGRISQNPSAASRVTSRR